MIEIEFRAKSIGGEWVYGVLMPFWNRDKEIKMYCIIPYNIGLTKDTSIWEIQIQVDPDTIGQFTGKRDENAKKIYTGDIVHNGERAMEVIFHNAAFRILAQGHDRNNAMTIYEASQKWILNKIGNVHDNPELLNV